jgi:PBP1b-binding outer membrane lipoprotein LpoB
MKKALYSIGLVCAMLFTACSEDRGTSTEVADANENETVDPNNINDYDQPGTAGTKASTPYTDAAYQQHAQLMSDKIATDLQLDDATATELTKIYYKRNLQLGDLEQGTSFSSTERMGGQTNETTSMNTDKNHNNSQTSTTSTMDRATIDRETDKRLKEVLTPEQYRRYEQNRDTYHNMHMKSDGTKNNIPE